MPIVAAHGTKVVLRDLLQLANTYVPCSKLLLQISPGHADVTEMDASNFDYVLKILDADEARHGFRFPNRRVLLDFARDCEQVLQAEARRKQHQQIIEIQRAPSERSPTETPCPGTQPVSTSSQSNAKCTDRISPTFVADQPFSASRTEYSHSQGSSQLSKANAVKREEDQVQ